ALVYQSHRPVASKLRAFLDFAAPRLKARVAREWGCRGEVAGHDEASSARVSAGSERKSWDAMFSDPVERHANPGSFCHPCQPKAAVHALIGTKRPQARRVDHRADLLDHVRIEMPSHEEGLCVARTASLAFAG